MSLWFALTRNLLLVRKRSNARAWQRRRTSGRQVGRTTGRGGEKGVSEDRPGWSSGATSPSGGFSLPNSSAPSGSSRSAATPTGRLSRGRSAPPTLSRNAATPVSRRSRELTGGLGVHSVIKVVGTQEAMLQPSTLDPCRWPCRLRGGVPRRSHPGDELFMGGVHIHGGPAPVRRFLPELIRLIWDRKIDAGKVVDLTLPLDRVAEGYKAMDQRRRPRSCSRSEPPPGVYRQRQPFVGVPDALTRHTETPCQPHVRSSGPRC
jgi:hypothetical protein